MLEILQLLSHLLEQAALVDEDGSPIISPKTLQSQQLQWAEMFTDQQRLQSETVKHRPGPIKGFFFPDKDSKSQC